MWIKPIYDYDDGQNFWKLKSHKNENNSPYFYGKWMHLGRNITHERLLSQCLSSFRCSPMMACLKKMFYGEIIWHLKGDWKDCVITNEMLGAFLSSTSYSIWEGHKILRCSNTLKRNELEVYISLNENKLVWFTNS